MSLVTTRTGDQLLAFHPGAELQPLEEYPDLLLTFACVIPRYEGKVLFVFNVWRQEWELPSGLIEPGESPYDAAVRELAEESGQVATFLSYAGLLLLGLKNGAQLELGAVYRCELEQLQPFKENVESTTFMLWDLHDAVEGHVNEIAFMLAKLGQ